MESRWNRAAADAKRWRTSKRELAGAIVPAVIALAALRMLSTNEAQIDAAIVLVAAVAGAILTPAAVYLWSAYTAPRRILWEEVERLGVKIDGMDPPEVKPANRRPISPENRAMYDALMPFIHEARFLEARKSRPGDSDSDEFIVDVDDWSQKVAAILEPNALFARQWASEAPLSSMRPGTVLFDHKIRMLQIIFQTLDPGLKL